MKLKIFFSHSMLVAIGFFCFFPQQPTHAAIHPRRTSTAKQTSRKFYLRLSSDIQNNLERMSLTTMILDLQPYLVFWNSTKQKSIIRTWHSLSSHVSIPFTATTIQLFIPTINGTKEFIFTEQHIHAITESAEKDETTYTIALTNDETNKTIAHIGRLASVYEQNNGNRHLFDHQTEAFEQQPLNDFSNPIATPTPHNSSAEEREVVDLEWRQYCATEEPSFQEIIDTLSTENLLTT